MQNRSQAVPSPSAGAPSNPVTGNPILPGFYPDPSVCRAGDDYYLVTSSFAYFPGIPIFHSTDLAHWRQIGHVLDRPSQLDLTRQGISQGIYAPAIRHHDGVFYLVTTLVGGGGNFFVTARDPAGPWSDPVWLPGVDGIDPSFFFDDDGKAYLINNGPPPEGKPLYAGHRAIWLQEFDVGSLAPIGKRGIIVNGGTNLADRPIWIEGPHLFRKDGMYFLLAAEGGTGTDHSEVIFRSRDIRGPYEPFAGNPILTQRDLPAERPFPVTCTGHADLVQTPGGDWVAVFLGCRPYVDGHFNTGRETFFHPVDWSGEWPIILPRGVAVPAAAPLPAPPDPGATSFAAASADRRDDFGGPELGFEWNFIRTPKAPWHELRDEGLVLQGRPLRLTDIGNPSFVGRRLQHADAEFSTLVIPETGKDLEAGLAAFQNEAFFYALSVIRSGGAARVVVASAAGEIASLPLAPGASDAGVFLRLRLQGSRLTCEAGLDGREWTVVGGTLDGTQLSTATAGGFVGTYLGLYAFASSPAAATFRWAAYRQLGATREQDRTAG